MATHPPVESSNPPVSGVSTNYAYQKRSTRNSDPKCNMLNTVFYVDSVIRVMWVMTFVSSVNRYTPVRATQKMMISGLAVISVIAG